MSKSNRDMEIVIVVKVPEIADLDGQDADNVIDIVQDHMAGLGYEWWIDEVIGNAREALAQLAQEPTSHAQLTVVRRAFHTLKGSSRMVGLNEFGEAGWACEQLYNTWLASQQPASPDLQTLTRDALGEELLGARDEGIVRLDLGLLALDRGAHAGEDQVELLVGQLELGGDLREGGLAGEEESLQVEGLFLLFGREHLGLGGGRRQGDRRGCGGVLRLIGGGEGRGGDGQRGEEGIVHGKGVPTRIRPWGEAPLRAPAGN